MAIAVPGNISSGDLLTINVEDAINPSIVSSYYAITLRGNVTGSQGATTTTTAPPPPVALSPS